MSSNKCSNFVPTFIPISNQPIFNPIIKPIIIFNDKPKQNIIIPPTPTRESSYNDLLKWIRERYEIQKKIEYNEKTLENDIFYQNILFDNYYKFIFRNTDFGFWFKNNSINYSMMIKSLMDTIEEWFEVEMLQQEIVKSIPFKNNPLGYLYVSINQKQYNLMRNHDLIILAINKTFECLINSEFNEEYEIIKKHSHQILYYLYIYTHQFKEHNEVFNEVLKITLIYIKSKKQPMMEWLMVFNIFIDLLKDINKPSLTIFNKLNYYSILFKKLKNKFKIPFSEQFINGTIEHNILACVFNKCFEIYSTLKPIYDKYLALNTEFSFKYNININKNNYYIISNFMGIYHNLFKHIETILSFKYYEDFERDEALNIALSDIENNVLRNQYEQQVIAANGDKNILLNILKDMYGLNDDIMDKFINYLKTISNFDLNIKEINEKMTFYNFNKYINKNSIFNNVDEDLLKRTLINNHQSLKNIYLSLSESKEENETQLN